MESNEEGIRRKWSTNPKQESTADYSLDDVLEFGIRIISSFRVLSFRSDQRGNQGEEDSKEDIVDDEKWVLVIHPISQ